MKLYNLVLTIIFLSIGFIGCYTILSHPTVTKDEYSHKIKFYNDCSSCHTDAELMNYGYVYLDRNPIGVYDRSLPLWITPTYTTPWWMDIQIPVDNGTSNIRPNDETRLRNLDGGRTSAPTDFSIPSRNSGSSGSSSSSNSSSNNSTSSSNERNSRDSNSTKSRDNSGERKK